MPILSSVLLICTRNRATDLHHALLSVPTQVRLPDAVLVVDSSDDDGPKRVVQSFEKSNPELNVIYLHASRGLTKQRNVGLDFCKSRWDVVHFVDDDVELQPLYIESLMSRFESDPALVGAGGLVLGASPIPFELGMRLIGRASKRQGAVLRSGANTGAHGSPAEIGVEWLPGCSMSFRLEAIAGLRFDEERSGYALGEDVDFGLKASRRGKLVHVPEARLLHKLSPDNRHTRAELEIMGIENRWQLAVDHPDAVKKWAVVLSSAALAGARVLKALVTRRPDRLPEVTVEFRRAMSLWRHSR